MPLLLVGHHHGSIDLNENTHRKGPALCGNKCVDPAVIFEEYIPSQRKLLDQNETRNWPVDPEPYIRVRRASLVIGVQA